MARKPVHELGTPPRDAIWKSIRTFKGREFTQADVRGGTNVSSKGTVQSYFTCLVAAGIVEETFKASRPGEPSVYRLANDPGAETPRLREDGTAVTQGLATEALWRTMKRIGQFTIEDLALFASTKRVPVSAVAARDYIRYLKMAGLVRVLKEASQSKPPSKELLLFVKSRDVGPKPPQIQRIKQVWDPNSETVLWPKDCDDE